jgi:hypothetical protein
MNKLNVTNFPMDVPHVISKNDAGTTVTADDRYFKRVAFGLTRCLAKDERTARSVLFVFLPILFFALSLVGFATAADKPNIIIFLADDQVPKGLSKEYHDNQLQPSHRNAPLFAYLHPCLRGGEVGRHHDS